MDSRLDRRQALYAGVAVAAAVTCNETFLVAAADGALYAIAARTGSVLWKRPLASSPAGLAADPALGVVYAADRTGTV